MCDSKELGDPGEAGPPLGGDGREGRVPACPGAARGWPAAHSTAWQASKLSRVCSVPFRGGDVWGPESGEEIQRATQGLAGLARYQGGGFRGRRLGKGQLGGPVQHGCWGKVSP